MNESMQRMDFEEGIKSLTGAYKEATDVLIMQDPLANQRVDELLRIWWDVLSEDFQFADLFVTTVLSDEQSVSDHRTAVDQLAQAIREFNSANIDVWSGVLLGTLQAYLKKVRKRAVERAAKVMGSESQANTNYAQAQLEWRTVNLLLQRMEGLELAHRLRVATRLAEEAVRDAQKAADDARNAAGFSAGSKLTAQFDDLALKEGAAAKKYRFWTVVTVIAAVVSSYFLGPGENAQTGHAVFRIALLAGMLGLATYLGRQAAHHRTLSAWAGTIKVQLLTFDGYLAPVNDESLRDQMRVAFAARVFGSSPENKDEPSPTLSSPVSELVAQFARGGQGTKL
ncbi:hypothetical protein [Arthrobacter sulfonylureivorans]|uniref:Uncharacterized protein n=1 Tax=Arthrobacter sulfonylureivorans TaxID=2486855 RepID=A0ABY3WAQ1_9MICC|nr:hypothetical protein [Arthrobacter sulfonylureivorans]UNK47091.1 hypothetical protein MNQ99_07040 [Arthrobacter sulfonylureivorans]